MSTWGRIAGIAGIATGVIGAAALGGVTAQRRAVRRYHVTATGEDPGEPYDALEADRVYSVVADDGVVLHVEESGPVDADLTIVFAHGWTLRSGAWHFQRLGLAGPGFGSGDGPVARMVFYDQRSHGRSGRADEDHVTMADLAGDLAAVIATAVPDGPIAIIGHSMGGMATMTLAGLRPDLFAERVHGVGLVSTAATRMALPGIGRTLISTGNPLFRAVTATAARYPKVIERTRSGSRDAVWLLTRTLGFSRENVPGDLVDYLDEMISSVPIEVIADFIPAVMNVDTADALPALADIPTVLIVGDKDRMTPMSRTEFIAEALPRAEMVVIPDAGHMAMMEAPVEVNDALRPMLLAAVEHAAAATAAREAAR
ncbi:alpha/beta fold hydrolase [Nakamurella sp. YIM 132087]|uniref:Alpha/beta fold hydrolase n=1 Tax=Nakamurella alba TaxID=2665158 RepID=A0A7K1FJU6_9ACTN|nr:alpha/beta hydrolase [Nakamurella alba]MTD14350.1 alpha/beta fold hydrolase [Nakamurella alba]